ncbi:MAG: trypsin-like peptidase domain-containing protein [Gemmatimonadota bacterium]
MATGGKGDVAPPGNSAPPATTPILLHLSGPRQGATEPLTAPRLLLGTSAEADIHFPEDWGPQVAPRHATLSRQGDSYLLRTEPPARVRINGRPVESRLLSPGDLVELGPGGPILRFRVRSAATMPHKSLSDAFADCVDCARYGSDTLRGRAGILLASMPRELLTRTAPRVRGVLLALLVALGAATAFLGIRTVRLERRLAAEGARLQSAAELLEKAEQNRLTAAEVERIRRELTAGLGERVEALEARGEVLPALIASASRAVIFLQGAYGFRDPASGRYLRTATGPGGRLPSDPSGRPVITAEGEGPVLEMRFTGTAFFVSPDGLLLTNRHVARPWEFDETAMGAVRRGLIPHMRRLIGYLPGRPDPFDVEMVSTSDSADLALLRWADARRVASSLQLSPEPARPGQEVVVLGYPTGIRALLARTNQRLVDSIFRQPAVDFWGVARELSDGGHIAPLATRGIVGQVTPDMIAYDAETTRGGSGGPVLAVDGTVVAVTVGILPEFGGSNLGVPAAQARVLLEPFLAPREEARQGSVP